MGRPGIIVSTLYNHTVEELKRMRNSSQDRFSRAVLTAVIMRYEGFSTIEISKFLLISKQTAIDYIKNWNAKGLDALIDHRGGSEGTFTAEMVDDLLNTAIHTKPKDFGFIGNVWTCPLLVEYIYQNYGIRYSKEYIRILLVRNNLSYKRAQRKPTKADKGEQEAFKKNETASAYCRKLF